MLAHSVEGDVQRRAAPGPDLLAPGRLVQQQMQRDKQQLGHFFAIRVKSRALRCVSGEGMNDVVAGRDIDGRERTEKLQPVGDDTDLLLSLAQRGLLERSIPFLPPAARQRDLTAVVI